METYEKKIKKKPFRAKWLVILAVFLLITGICILFVGIILGGSWSSVFYRGETKNMEEIYQGVEKINIKSDFGLIRINEGETFSIVGENVSQNGFQSTVENGEWVIKDEDKNLFSLWGIHWNFGVPDESILTITVPKGFVADEIKIKIGAGELYLNDIVTNNLDLNIGAGQGIVSNIKVEKEADVKVGAGQIIMENAHLKESNLDCGAGKLEISGSITGDSQVKCGIGEIAMLLNGRKEDYEYKVKCGIGEVRIDGTSYSNEKTKGEFSELDKSKFDLNCGIGKISLNFNLSSDRYNTEFAE